MILEGENAAGNGGEEDDVEEVGNEYGVIDEAQDDQSQDSSEEDEGPDEFDRTDGFLNDEEEEDEVEEETKQSKDDDKDEEDIEDNLDEEDYDLLAENQVRVKRPITSKDGGKRKRLRKGDEGRIRANKSEDLHKQLFGDEEEDANADKQEKTNLPIRKQQRRVDFDDDDDMGDFIEYEEGEEPIHDQGTSRSSEWRKTVFVDKEAEMDAFDIFGDVEEMLSARLQMKGMTRDEAEGADSGEDLEEGDDGARRVSRKAKAAPKLFEIVEPDLADKLKLTESDDIIRIKDIPERIAVSLLEKGGIETRITLSEDELENESAWIFQELYKEGVSKAVELEQEPMENDMPEYPDEEKYTHLRKLIQMKLRIVEDDLLLLIPKGSQDEERSIRREKSLIRNIKRFLSLHVNEAYEIPYIGMYCRDHIRHLLDTDLGDEKLGMLEYEIERETAIVQQNEAPTLSKRDIRRIKHFKELWRLQDSHNLYMKVRARKAKLVSNIRRFSALEFPGDILHQMADQIERGSGENQENEDPSGSQRSTRLEIYSQEDMDDAELKFKLYAHCTNSKLIEDNTESVQGGSTKSKSKRPLRKSHYTRMVGYGFRDLIGHFGMTPEQVAAALHGEDVRLNFPKGELHEQASKLVNTEYSTAETVIAAARQLFAMELQAEPLLRRRFRAAFRDAAYVSTWPTGSGTSSIDPFSIYGPVKWLCKKPARAFLDDQFAIVQKGVRDGLLEMEISVSDDTIESLFAQPLRRALQTSQSNGDANGEYLSREDHCNVIIDIALKNFIIPQMAKDTEHWLMQSSLETIGYDYSVSFREIVEKGPITVERSINEDDDSGETEEISSVRVMAVSHDKPTAVVMVDENGELVDILHLSIVSQRIHSHQKELWARLQDEQQSLMNFIMLHKPHLILVGATNMECKILQEQISEIVLKIVEEHPRDGLPEGLTTINTFFADESLAEIYQGTKQAENELGDHQLSVKRAVALARSAQDPLAVAAALLSAEGALLRLNLHRMQDSLSKEERYELCERVLCTLFAQVGVDLEDISVHPWRQASLHYVPGLGPRKAEQVLRFMQQSTLDNRDSSISVRVRTDLFDISHLSVLMKKPGVEDHPINLRDNFEYNGEVENSGLNFRGLGPNVFSQAAGSLRLNLHQKKFLPLDSTRIHPKEYHIADQIMADALEVALPEHGYDDYAYTYNDDCIDATGRNVNSISEDPAKLFEIDLENYAAHIASVVKDEDGREEGILAIRAELIYPNGEWREPFTQLPQDREFELLTGESLNSLRNGQLVSATVRSVIDRGVTCTLESGLSGFIAKHEITDTEHMVEPIMSKISPGQVIPCRVVSINQDKFIVDLTCRGSILRDTETIEKEVADPYYERNHNDILDKMQYKKKDIDVTQKKRVPKVPVRPIRHPKFKNMSSLEANEFLELEETGEYVIRPSSRGLQQLTLTMKFFDGIFWHLDVIEEGEKTTSDAKLAPPLNIMGDRYEDLDDIMFNFVNPVRGYIAMVKTHRKFVSVEGNYKMDIISKMEEEKEKQPKQAVYCLSVNRDHPGFFMLVYVISSPRAEYIGVNRTGFRFRSQNFRNIDELLGHFKKYPSNPAAQRRYY